MITKGRNKKNIAMRSICQWKE